MPDSIDRALQSVYPFQTREDGESGTLLIRLRQQKIHVATCMLNKKSKKDIFERISD